MPLSKNDIANLVDDYLRADRFKPRRKFDLVDDFERFLFIACELPGALARPNLDQVEPGKALGKPTLGDILDFVASYLHATNSTLSKQEWWEFYAAVQVARHGGTKVRIRKRPALALINDAKRMTPRQLQEKYPNLCRSRIYAVIKEANRRK